jgi:hypothetical protein
MTMDELTLVAQLRDNYPAGIDLIEPERRLAAEISAATSTGPVHGTRRAPRTRRTPRMRAAGSGRRFGPKLVVGGTVAAGIAAAAIIALQSVPAHPVPRPGSSRRTSADALGLRLASYASKAAASEPAWQPNQWVYSEILNPEAAPKPGATNPTIMWMQVDYHQLAYYQHGKLHIRNEVPYLGQITDAFGRPLPQGDLYSYLQSLPTTPAALRAIIEHNLKTYPQGPKTGPFASANKPLLWNAIEGTLTTIVLPPKLLAAVYGVLAADPGVHFDKSVTDNAGQAGVGFYVTQHFLTRTYVHVVMINPSTYAYLGLEIFSPVTQTWHFTMGGKTYTRTIPKGEIDWTDLVASGIVQEPGQKP